MARHFHPFTSSLNLSMESAQDDLEEELRELEELAAQLAQEGGAWRRWGSMGFLGYRVQ